MSYVNGKGSSGGSGRGGRGFESRGSGRGGFNGGGGDRGRGGAGGAPRGRGRSSRIIWSGTKSCESNAPASGLRRNGWKSPANLPSDAAAVKALMPKFPKVGTNCERTINALTNHWLINIRLPKVLKRYEATVRVEKPRDEGKGDKDKGKGKEDGDNKPTLNKDINKKLMMVLMEKIRKHFNLKKSKLGVMTDFSRIVICNGPLESASPLSFDIHHKELPKEDDDDVIYHVSLDHAACDIDLESARLLINERGIIDHPHLTEIKQIYNILMKNVGTTGYIPMERNTLIRSALPDYDTRFGNVIGAGLMNWKGASLVCTLGATWKPYINVEICNSAFRIGQSVLKTIEQILNNEEKARDVTKWTQQDYQLVKAELKYCKVRRLLVNGKTRDSRLDDICGFGSDSKDAQNKKTAIQLVFKDHNGQMTNVANYFRDVLGKTMRFPNGPVVKLGKACVPAELCTVKEAQSINRLLSGMPQRKMLEKCTETPKVKYGNIHKIVDELQLRSPQNHQMTSFGLAVPDKEMLKLPRTRVLQAPELCYGLDHNGRENGRGRVIPEEGQWEIFNSNVHFYTPAKITSWAIVLVNVHVDMPIVRNFCMGLMEAGQRRGMTFPNPTLPIHDVKFNPHNHNGAVEALTRKFADIRAKFHDPQNSFILCIIPNKPNEEYSQVKQAAELAKRAEVLTQCVQFANLRDEKRKVSVTNNITLKINTKMRGINHVPLYPESSLGQVSILAVPTLILGIDVNHPSLPIAGRPTGYPSFASVTGSLDKSGMPYMMHVKAQIRLANKAIGSAEVVENLDGIVKDMLDNFSKTTKIHPKRIIVFRDGVGDSQFPEILQTEMLAIRKACEAVGSTYKPPITFIAVQKRHKVRFFIEQGPNAVSDQNVPPGTVVDKDIVESSDFYLLSHKGMLGTSRPTHYHVLWDDSEFTSDEIQGLAYYLCYNYARCNRSVSYPAPTYYSHWAALRAKELANGYRDWTGDQESLDRLNANLKRSSFVVDNFPMHFI